MKRHEDILKISIKDYLEGIGIPTRKEGSRYFASSPFSSDRNWSFCIYPSNTYFDFSSGHGGNIINLVSKLNNVSTRDAARALQKGLSYEKYKANYEAPRTQPKQDTPFDYKKYINTDPEECEKIKAYAASRGIKRGFECGVFFTPIYSDDGSRVLDWVRTPALAFIHTDKNNTPCGIKLRRLDNKNPRFSARGKLHHYFMPALSMATPQKMTLGDLENVLYVVEGEANANSLWEYFDGTSSVLSTGGVSLVLTREELPTSLAITPSSKIKLLIDYDGNEELYQERLKLYEGLRATPVRLILPKGEDINSLYNKNQMWMIENLLIN